MFERFTDRARRVVILAQEEARMLNHNYVGTEHILLGLIHEGEGIAAKALEALGITLVGVREQVEQIIGRGNEPPPGHIPFTPRAKKVLELSLREALQLGHDYIGTEHILLGLLREGQGVAAQVLVRLGADLNRVRQQVIQQIAQEGEARDTSPAASERAEGARPQRPAGREFWLTEIQSALAKIEDRLTAIERHLGMSDRPAVPDDPLGEKPGEKLGEEPGEKPGGPLGEKPGDSPGDEAADG